MPDENDDGQHLPHIAASPHRVTYTYEGAEARKKPSDSGDQPTLPASGGITTFCYASDYRVWKIIQPDGASELITHSADGNTHYHHQPDGSVEARDW